MVNEFARFYSCLGQDSASKIQGGRISIQNYINKIPMNINSLIQNYINKISININSLVLQKTNVQEIESLIGKLPNKTSCGHDSTSNVMLK